MRPIRPIALIHPAVCGQRLAPLDDLRYGGIRRSTEPARHRRAVCGGFALIHPAVCGDSRWSP
ncbi:MAG: hypothetical protein IKD23_05365 [Lentisphaeria bacterium]|nr:hypothetical protein [Lentisphaeria bacterium]